MINAKYAIYRLLHMLHIKLHISAYFHCTFFAYLTNTVYIFAYFLHISCILFKMIGYTCIFLACICVLSAYLSIFLAYFVNIFYTKYMRVDTCIYANVYMHCIMAYALHHNMIIMIAYTCNLGSSNLVPRIHT